MKQGDKKGKSKREMEDSIQIWGGFFFQYKKENIFSTLNLEIYFILKWAGQVYFVDWYKTRTEWPISSHSTRN